ncbi:MAG: CRISPR-associated endonuclease Cas2 [Pelotomaculaceae bacterium]|nr:CRISPR-associated endonuclease Cas2 [Bacillota bacterium]
MAYDVKDDKRRSKIHETLKEYAAAVQYSLFEGYITKADMIKLRYKLKQQMLEKEDSICFYRQCINCRDNIIRYGQRIVVFGKDDIII